MDTKKLRRLERLLSQTGSEKRSKIVTIKMEYSLWKALKLVSNNVSDFVRKTLVLRLQKELKTDE